jgi:AcrR family transcriptional regulator
MRERIPAVERRAAVLDTACRVFARCSYRGATTAKIAREAGITEPILYRHFESKQALYLACIDQVWARVREAWERTVAAEPDPAAWMSAMAGAFFEPGEERSAVASLWLHALTEGGEEAEVRRFLWRHLRDAHSSSRTSCGGVRRPAPWRPTATRARRRGSSWRSACWARSPAVSEGWSGGSSSASGPRAAGG